MQQIEKNVVDSFTSAKKDLLILNSNIKELANAQQFVVKKTKEHSEFKKEHELLRNSIKSMLRTQEFILKKMTTLQAAVSAKPKTITKTKTKTRMVVRTINKTPKKVFVVSKEGKSYHIKACPFAKNIKPKRKLVFKAKKTAENKGYKPCKCIK